MRGLIGPPRVAQVPGAGPAAPSPALQPDDVVALQLAALRAEPPSGGSSASPGIVTAWAFASPGNRAATGPVSRFAAMLHGPAYGGLLGHRAAQAGPVRVSGDTAEQEVLVLTRDDQALGFTWVLGRCRTAPYAGCWLTDAVLRHPDRPAGPG